MACEQWHPVRSSVVIEYVRIVPDMCLVAMRSIPSEEPRIFENIGSDLPSLSSIIRLPSSLLAQLLLDRVMIPLNAIRAAAHGQQVIRNADPTWQLAR